MNSSQLRRLGLGAAVALTAACAGAAPALASTPSTTAIDASGCTAPVLSQPLIPFGDSNWYTMVPGETPDAFNGAGWTLTGGASVKTTTLADGTTGQVLDLPSGSRAVSPTFCVTSSYSTARAEVRDVAGGEGVQFDVSYAGTPSWTTPRNTGELRGGVGAWLLSAPVSLEPNETAGWQLVRFTFVPDGTASDFRIYNFWVDPRIRT